MSNTQKWQIRQALPSEVEHLSDAFVPSILGVFRPIYAGMLRNSPIDKCYIENNPTFVIEAAGNTMGFYSLEHISTSEVELSYLFVEPTFIGKGYGRKLIPAPRIQ